MRETQMNKVLAVATAGLIVLAPRKGPAAMWYVDGTLAQSGNGKSWDTAFKTIQEGIDASSHGDTVIAARAIYFEKIAFKGKNIVLRSLDPLDPDVVAATMIIGTPAPGSVVTFSGTENDKCVLAGFGIRGGDAISGGGGD